MTAKIQFYLTILEQKWLQGFAKDLPLQVDYNGERGTVKFTCTGDEFNQERVKNLLKCWTEDKGIKDLTWG